MMIILILLIRNQNLGKDKSFVQDTKPDQEQRQDAKPDFIYLGPSNLTTMRSCFCVPSTQSSQLDISLILSQT